MKILIITGSYPPEIGGIATLVKSFAEGLVTRGIQAHVLAATPGASRNSCPTLPISDFALPPRGYLRRIAACRRAVSRILRQSLFDRIVAGSWSPYAVQLPSRIAARRIPLDIFCHGMDILEPARSARYRFLMRRTWQRASKVITISRFTARHAESLGARADQVIILPPGVDSERFIPGPPDAALLSRYGIPQGVPVLLSVGRLVARKGHNLVLRALPRVLQDYPTAVYWVIGEGPEQVHLSSLAQSLGIQNSVRFAGRVSDEELPRCYRSAQIFLMPSRRIPEEGDVEGFGIVFLEAGCCQLPVIGGKSGGMQDAVVDGVTGYLIDPGSSEECAARLLELLSQAHLRQTLGAEARRRVVRDFQPPMLAARYLEALP